MDDLLGVLFAAAVQFSGLPAIDGLPPVQALPYEKLLHEVCADLEEDISQQQVEYQSCIDTHRMLPSSCGGLAYQVGKYERCTHQHGLVAAYIIEQHKIVYRNSLDLGDDTDNSFIVHEFVHALQRHYFGSQVFETCRGVVAMERQAYQAQQRYLESRGQMLRVGERLRFVTCSDVM